MGAFLPDIDRSRMLATDPAAAIELAFIDPGVVRAVAAAPPFGAHRDVTEAIASICAYSPRPGAGGDTRGVFHLEAL